MESAGQKSRRSLWWPKLFDRTLLLDILITYSYLLHNPYGKFLSTPPNQVSHRSCPHLSFVGASRTMTSVFMYCITSQLNSHNYGVLQNLYSLKASVPVWSMHLLTAEYNIHQWMKLGSSAFSLTSNSIFSTALLHLDTLVELLLQAPMLTVYRYTHTTASEHNNCT